MCINIKKCQNDLLQEIKQIKIIKLSIKICF